MTILIYCREREIMLWGKYKNEEEAYKAMENDLAKVLKINVPENWNDVEGRYDDFDIQYDSAWVNNNDNHDWKIINL